MRKLQPLTKASSFHSPQNRSTYRKQHPESLCFGAKAHNYNLLEYARIKSNSNNKLTTKRFHKVYLVSAIFVEMIILRHPAGGILKARR